MTVSSVTCPNEECEDDIEVTEFVPYDPGVSSGPVEACYPPEGGYCRGADKCPRCGAELDDEFWECAYDLVVEQMEERNF